MSVSGISNLSELISNQSLEQGQNAPGGPQPAQAQGIVSTASAGDSFTPSTQATAQDAGLFQVSQFALSAATANVLSAQTATPQTAQNAVPVQTAQTTTAGAASAQGASDTTPNVQTAVTTPAPKQAATPASVVTAALANTQEEVQSLNTVLLGLGFSNNEIQNVDRVATLTNDFNPPLYSDLVQQFESQVGQQTAGVTTAANTPATQTKPPTV